MHAQHTLSLLTRWGMTAIAIVSLTACGRTDSPSSMSGMDRSQGSAATTMTGNMTHAMSADLGPKDSRFDLRFIDAMILHHQGGIMMAEKVLSNARHSELKALAQTIITNQQQEMDQLKQWRKQWYPAMGEEPMTYHAEMDHTMPMSKEMRSAMMMSTDLGAADQQFDLRFLNAMIPHHEGALIMADQAVSKSDRPEVVKLAQSILTNEQQDIDRMKQWRKQWYGQ